jgi:hypothetical protein
MIDTPFLPLSRSPPLPLPLSLSLSPTPYSPDKRIIKCTKILLSSNQGSMKYSVFYLAQKEEKSTFVSLL